MRQIWLATAGLILVPFLVAGTASGDEFRLSNGGRLVGEWLNRNQSPRQTYVVKTAHGQVTLPVDSVRSVIDFSVARQQYEQLAAQANDTIEDHWEISNKCRELGLVAEREKHLERILEQQPDHAQARHALGYTKVNGRWLNTEQWRRDQGLVLHGGSWRYRQDVENEVLQQQRGDLEREWRDNINRWRRAVKRNNRLSNEALANLQAIRHARAVPALAQYLDAKNEPRNLKLLYIEVISHLENAAATDALIKAYMEDKDELVRDRALDTLARWKSKRAVAFFLKQLESSDNRTVNGAGYALGTIGDRSVVRDLIDALVTQHKFQIGGPGISAGFGNGGSGGLNVGGRPKIVKKDFQNRSVLDALMAMTDGTVNFEFDESSWKRWYVQINTPRDVDLRRIK